MLLREVLPHVPLLVDLAALDQGARGPKIRFTAACKA